MSSYEVGGVGVSGGLLEGTATIVAAAAILVPTAIIAGTGYAVYQLGKSVQEEMKREHREAIECEARKKAEEKIKNDIAQAKITKSINKAQVLLQRIEDEKNDLFDTGIKERLTNLHQYLLEAASNVTASETADIEYNAIIISNRIKMVSDELKVLMNLKDRTAVDEKMVSAIEELANFFQSINVESYKDILNVSATDLYEEKKRDYIARTRDLAIHIKALIYREIKRFETIPIKSVDIESLASVLKGVDQEIHSLLTDDIDIERYDTRLSAIEKRIEEYNVLSALMDKDEEAFLSAYYAYKNVCDKVHLEAKDMMDFDSYEELEAEIKGLSKKLDRMKKCSELFEKLGKETYLCMAMEYELSRLEYGALSKDAAEEFLKKELVNASVGEKLSPYYLGDEESLMQIYEMGDGIYVQVEIHKDGSTTIETATAKGKSEIAVKEIQQKHCNKSKKLEKALQENWFIETNIFEVESPDVITYEFSGRAVDNDRARTEAEKIKQNRLKRAQKETEKRRKAKANRRAKALKG